MVRLEDLNITFFHIPKNAGSSIQYWLKDNCDGEVYDGEIRHETPRNLKGLFDDFGWSFCVLRNPYDRVASWYKHFVKQNKINVSFKKYVRRASEFENSRYYKWPGEQLEYLTCDYIMRYENLSKDFKVIQDKVKCYKPLGLINANGGSYVDLYKDKDTINLVRDRYQVELHKFNYDFGG